VIAGWIPRRGGAAGTMRHYHRACLSWTARLMGTRFVVPLFDEPLPSGGRKQPIAPPPLARLEKRVRATSPKGRIMKDSPCRLLTGVPQSPVHHPEGDALQHTLLVWWAARRIAAREGLNGEPRRALLLAALYHDLGKATCTQVHPDGRITSHRHDERSAALAGAAMRCYGVSHQLRHAVVALCREHMHARELLSARARARLERRLYDSGVALHLLMLLVEADTAGRGNPARATAD